MLCQKGASAKDENKIVDDANYLRYGKTEVSRGGGVRARGRAKGGGAGKNEA